MATVLYILIMMSVTFTGMNKVCFYEKVTGPELVLSGCYDDVKCDDLDELIEQISFDRNGDKFDEVIVFKRLE